MDEKQGSVVKEGDYIVIQRQNFIKLHQLSVKNSFMLGKDKLDLSRVVGKPFWTVYRMVPNGSKKREFCLEVCDRVDSASDCVSRETGFGLDNRNIVSDNKSQLLSTEDICELRESGYSSTGIVTALIENSLSFKNKTEYSQEKYLKKKEKKYHEFITIRKPSLRIISEVFYSRDQFKILGLRYDTLSQLISAINIQPTGNYLLYEKGTQGLVGAAILNYMSESATLINLTLGVHSQKQAILAMNLSQNKMNCFLSVKIINLLDHLNKDNDQSIIDPSDCTNKSNGVERSSGVNFKNSNAELSEKVNLEVNHIDISTDGETKKRKLESETERDETRKKPKWMDELAKAADILRKQQVDGLVIATKEYPLEVIDNFLCYIKPSRPLVIYSIFKEPLVELYVELKKRKNVLNMHVTETWLRNYQILPDRTHPHVNMSPSSGYLLTATIVA